MTTNKADHRWTVPHKTRIEALMLCGAHEFALDVVKNCTGSGSQLHYVLAQAIRMLELIAAIGESAFRLYDDRCTPGTDAFGFLIDAWQRRIASR